jgi:hypothetical protein
METRVPAHAHKVEFSFLNGNLMVPAAHLNMLELTVMPACGQCLRISCQ